MHADFVNILVKKPLYQKLKERAKMLGTTPGRLIYNAMLLILKDMTTQYSLHRRELDDNASRNHPS